MSTSKTTQCVLDDSILNEDTLPEMSDLALSIFASLCGRNRGAFVLSPPDGQTYGCLNFPAQWQDLAPEVNVTKSDDIVTNYADGNITAAEVLDLVENLAIAVYASSANVAKDPYACNVNGLTRYENCPMAATTPPLLGSMKAVTLRGILDEAPWGWSPKLTSQDFEEMKELGLTSVQIPIVSFEKKEKIEGIIEMAKEAGLTVILQQSLNQGDLDDDKDTSTAGADFIDSLTQLALDNADTVVAISISSKDDISTVREVTDDMAILVSITAGDLLNLDFHKYENVYASLDVSHSRTIADIVSSSSVEDRSKLFYHESTSCIQRSPIDYVQCYKGVPLFIGNGFDVSIDNCIYADSPDFKDYGQCDRFDETLDSPWWQEHRLSFLNRQLFALEQASLGWSFSAWKTTSDSEGISEPSHLLGLSHVAAAGLYPPSTTNTTLPACLNPPEPDFTLGDATLSPTMGPPPDCGDGWWNYTTQNCTFWIPPPVPTCAPALTASTTSPIFAGVLGGVVTAVVLWCTMIYGLGYRRLKYTTIPN